MRVRMMLEEKHLEWASHEIDLGGQENLEPWYMAINPKGLVPALVHDGVPITESSDIQHYLEEQFPEPPLRPSDLALAKDVNEWVDLASAIHVKAIKTWVYGTTGGATKSRETMAHYSKIEPDKTLVEFHQKALDGFSAEEIAEARAMIEDVFSKMQTRLTNHTFLVGNELSMADIAWLPQYVIFNMIGFDFGPYPAIVAWVKRLEKRPSYKPAIGDRLPSIPGWLFRPMMKPRQLYRSLRAA